MGAGKKGIVTAERVYKTPDFFVKTDKISKIVIRGFGDSEFDIEKYDQCRWRSRVPYLGGSRSKMTPLVPI